MHPLLKKILDQPLCGRGGRGGRGGHGGQGGGHCDRGTGMHMSRFFAKLGLNSRSCGLLKIVCPEICFDFLIDWGLVKP